MSTRLFLRAVDAAWRHPVIDKITLRMIGAGALLLQADYDRGTKDSDILESSSIDATTQNRLVTLTKKGTLLHQRWLTYIEFVPRGLPLLPQVPKWLEPSDLNEHLRNFRVEVLDVIDVVVSKLGRFHDDDQTDIVAMINQGLVPHAELVRRFRSAIEVTLGDASAERLPSYVRNLHRIERDEYLVDESDIELPDWIAERFD